MKFDSTIKAKGTLRFVEVMFLSWCFILLLSSCAGMKRTYNQLVMRGAIVDVKGSSVYVRVGSEDGAFRGQELVVYKMGRGQSRLPSFSESLIPTQGRMRAVPYYTKIYTGKVRITKVIDDHLSEAAILSGTVQTEDVAEVPLP
ncbi:MAG TPA: hypothetical protein VHO84_10440 [Syntrophorhabdaceae bacterium]|nr:hypothetical protein [Syntrophorhabdaceae bacterium]